MFFTTTLLTSCVKLLLIPAYRSTDFEVHRNWLAVTYSLPLKKWYFEDTSEWTLDYPPFFAWFQYLLSLIASYFDKDMLKVDNINYASEKAVLFLRLSVILTDFVYSYGVYRCCMFLQQKGWRKEVVLPILLITNCGLIMVDHIHFQYNGILYGILLLSIAEMLHGRYLLSALWFTILLNMKHIYIYLAPAYFVYLLRHYCIQRSLTYKNIFSKNTIKNISSLGFLVISIFAISFLPFVDHISQVLSRLFPFKRGLCHAYWAPNFWAFYNTVDKIGHLLLLKFGFHLPNKTSASMTGGLVQEFSHSLLPNVLPLTTMILTTVLMIPAMVKLFYLNKQPVHFIRCMVLCGMTSFLFGWHVHEKAILMVIIPMSILAIMEPTDAKLFLIVSTVGHYSLFPLLYPSSLVAVKVLLLVLYSAYAFYSMYQVYSLAICKYTLPLLNAFESIYVLGLVGVFLYENVVHKILGLNSRLPYLPLMITSVYCSIGIIYCWARYYLFFLKYDVNAKVRHKGNKDKVN